MNILKNGWGGGGCVRSLKSANAHETAEKLAEDPEGRGLRPDENKK